MTNKWTLLGFLCAIFLVYTIDRAMLGILAIPIQQDLGISDVAFGILNSAVFWAYAAVVPFAGLMGDRLPRLRLIGLAVVAWSLATVCAGFASGFWCLLLLASVAITVPQTFYGPSANALLAEYHVATRTVALSCHQAAFYTGWFASGAAVAAILSLFANWRIAYWTFGTVGLVLGSVFLWIGGMRREADGTVVKPVVRPDFRKCLAAYFRCPSALLASAGYIAVVFVGFGYSAWGPKFVARKFALSPAAAGTGVMFWHFAAAFVAIFIAGGVTDRVVGKWPRFRLVLQMSSLLLAAPLLVAFGHGSALVVVFAAAAGFGLLRGVFEANAFTSIFDVVPSDCRASAVGFTNVLAGVVGSFAPMLLGWLSQREGEAGLARGFAGMGIVLLVAAALLLFSALVTFNRDRKEIVR